MFFKANYKFINHMQIIIVLASHFHCVSHCFSFTQINTQKTISIKFVAVTQVVEPIILMFQF